MNRHADNDNDDDADIIGGWIIVCAEFLIPSQTKIFNYKVVQNQILNNFVIESFSL